jgi:hypothetical protein
MQRFLSPFMIIAFSLIVIATVAVADDDSSFLGTWEGIYTSTDDPSKVYTVVMKFDGDNDGNIFLRYFESGGGVLNPPPIILGHTPDLLTLRIKPGWRVYLQLEEDDLIRVKPMESGGPPFPTTFERKKNTRADLFMEIPY